jgi:hypothetical protein
MIQEGHFRNIDERTDQGTYTHKQEGTFSEALRDGPSPDLQTQQIPGVYPSLESWETDISPG